jgi:hypothetical protein
MSHRLRAQGVREDPHRLQGRHRTEVRRVTPAQWRLARQIQAILVAESGASLEELAGRIGAPSIDVRAAARTLYRMRRADFCWSFLAAVPPLTRGGGQLD